MTIVGRSVRRSGEQHYTDRERHFYLRLSHFYRDNPYLLGPYEAENQDALPSTSGQQEPVNETQHYHDELRA